MTTFSYKMRKEGKINTQMALRLLHEEFGIKPRLDDRIPFIETMRQEIPCEKTGEGKGVFWYFKIDDLRAYGQRLSSGNPELLEACYED